MLHLGPTSLITKFGYLAVAAIVGLESVGLPLPGEATLIAAAVYAGTTQRLNIWLVIACTSLGAIVGDNLGFWIGRELGFRLLIRWGSYVGLPESRIKVGQYLFQLHGGKIVFFGRFLRYCGSGQPFWRVSTKWRGQGFCCSTPAGQFFGPQYMASALTALGMC